MGHFGSHVIIVLEPAACHDDIHLEYKKSQIAKKKNDGNNNKKKKEKKVR